MDRLRCIEVFLEVAKGRSFSAAAERLGMSEGNVTKHVAWLETSLGARLLTRTTKSVALTDAGLSLLDAGADLLERYDQAQAAIEGSITSPRGALRVGTPPSFGAFHLVPLLTEFSVLHPDVQVILHLDDGRADLVKDGLDLSVRIAPSLRDTSYVAQKLAVVPQILVASDRYLAARGHPATPQDLLQHDCLVHALKSPTNTWAFKGPDGNTSVRVTGTIRANFGEALRHAAILGHGIAMHPTYMVNDDLREGRLRRVMPDYQPTVLDIFAVFPSRQHMPTRVRVFIDFLKMRFSDVSGWS